MATYNSLSEEEKSHIWSKLTLKIESEHTDAYKANLQKANSKSQIEACAGRYEGTWFRLREHWLANKVLNELVYDCLRVNFVIGDKEEVIFTSCKPIRKRPGL